MMIHEVIKELTTALVGTVFETLYCLRLKTGPLRDFKLWYRERRIREMAGDAYKELTDEF